MIFTAHQMLYGDQINKNDMGRARRTHGGEENCMQGFGGEP